MPATAHIEPASINWPRIQSHHRAWVRQHLQRPQARQEDQVHHLQVNRRLQRDRCRGGLRKWWLGTLPREAPRCRIQEHEDCMWPYRGVLGRIWRVELTTTTGQGYQGSTIRRLWLQLRLGLWWGIKVGFMDSCVDELGLIIAVEAKSPSSPGRLMMPESRFVLHFHERNSQLII